MQDLASLFNQALTSVGHQADVTDTEANTKSANLCRLWFAPARRAVLSAAYWPSARSLASLSVISTRELGDDWVDGKPWPGNTTAFNLPADCLRPQFMANFTRFTLGNLGGNKVLFTEAPTAFLYYTKDIEDPAVWESDLYDAVVATLAARLNMAKSGKLQHTSFFVNEAKSYIRSAAARIANEEDNYYESLPLHYAETGYTPTLANRYYYPVASFNLGAM